MVGKRRARRLPSAAILLVCALGGPADGQSAVGAWDSLELPHAPQGLASAIGLDPQTPRARLLLEAVRAAHAAPPGRSAEIDAVRGRLEAWLAGESVATDAGTGPVSQGNGDSAPTGLTVPLPLARSAWQTLLGETSDEGLAGALLRDRRAALLYFGLMGCDHTTRRFLASRPDLLAHVHREHAGAFAAFGRSLRVVDGRVALPGGERTIPIWERLVGEPVTDPESFIEAALRRHEGRLAFFIDTVAHLDDARRRFALSESETDAHWRLKRTEALARLFTDLHREWRIDDHPFARPALDGALILLTVRVTEDGRLAPPASRTFWEAVFSSSAPRPGRRRSYEGGVAADAAWLAERILDADVVKGRDRLGAVSFVQRAFGDVPAHRLDEVVRVARGFIETRTMVVALERLAATDVGLYARGVDHARRLTAKPSATGSVAQFQAAVVLLERLRARGVLTPEGAVTLVSSLIGVPMTDDGRYQGGLARWFTRDLFPAIGGPGQPGGAEQMTLEALAGRALRARPEGQPVTVEGESYVVDVSRAELTRLERVRDRQYGNRLDEALSLSVAAERLADSASPADATSRCAELMAAAEPLEAVSWPAPGLGAATAQPAQLLGPRCEQLLRRAQSAADLRTSAVARSMGEVVDVADAVFADTLVALVYALHVGDPAGAIELAPDIARRHRFVDEAGVHSGGGGAWALPEERLGAAQPWHVTGSLLGLEHGLGKLALRFLFGDMPSHPRVNDNERRTIALGLALLNPLALEDADRDAIVAALTRGRARLASPEVVLAELEAIAAAAGWSEWRRESVGWAAACDPESLLSLFTLTDYFWSGTTQPGASLRLDAWGPPTTPLDGDLRLAWPLARPWEELAGRVANGQLATRFVDMTLRVAETLAKMKLPASLAAGALAPALADLVHEAPVGHADDWYGLAGYVSRLPEERILDYIAALAAGGPLVPVEESGVPNRPGQ